MYFNRPSVSDGLLLLDPAGQSCWLILLVDPAG